MHLVLVPLTELPATLSFAQFAPNPASQSGGRIWPLATQFGVFSTCKSRQIQAWVALWRAFPQTQELVF
jgi:hypothetical protein